MAKGRSIDQAMMLHNLEKALERIVTDEYTKEAVEEQKTQEKNEIQQLFGYTDIRDLDNEQKSLGKLHKKFKTVSKKLLKLYFPATQSDKLGKTNDAIDKKC